MSAMRIFGAMLAVALAGLLLAFWPLAPWPFAAGLVIYAALLWRWNGLWLLLLPVTALVLDLTPFTGWLLLGEPDLLVLATIAVLLLRAPPPILALSGRAWLVLGGVSLTLTLATLRGLVIAEPPGGADLLYLTVWNGLRLVKPWVEIMLLLPFLAAELRRPGGADRLLAGMILLAVGIALVVLWERQTFPGLLNVSTDYRVVASFSSMHIGGGHIGAALALALPFLIASLAGRRPWVGLLALPPTLYALAVTFARTAYAAGLAATLVAALVAFLLTGQRAWRAMLPLLGACGLLGGIALAALETPYMAQRFTTIAPDLATREANWREGFRLHGDGVMAWAFGMGLGGYPRLAAATETPEHGPSFYRVLHGEAPYLSLVSRTPLYFGHRVPNAAIGEKLTLSLRWRAHAVDVLAAPPVTKLGGLGVILCQKLLLYSLDCAGARAEPVAAGEWQNASFPLTGPGEAQALWQRPLELSFTSAPGSVIDLSDIHLRTQDGRELLANGDFAAGVDRWFFTDDNHLLWRMKDQYLMTLFETGIAGLLAWLALIATAMLGALHYAARGRGGAGAAVAGAIVALLISSLFDAVLEASRLALVIELVLVSGVLLGETREG